MAIIRFAALDGSLTNFGIAKLDFNTETGALAVADLVLIKTEKTKVKTVRVSSDRLRRSQEIAGTVREALSDCSLVFAEIPTGAQSSDAAFAFGIVVGIYASIITPVIEISPSETKLAAVGTRTASKQEMIEWATEKFPDAPWRRVKRAGVLQPTLDNEHLADAVAIAHAGVKTAQFKQMVVMLNAMKAAA